MKKTIIKFSVCLLTFICTLILTSSIYNRGNNDMTTNMADATFPVVHMKVQDLSYNTLYGWKQDVDITFMREHLTVLEKDRCLSFSIDKYGCEINSMMFEVRNLDGTRLVEQTPIQDYEETATRLSATVTLKDLMDENQEYNWILYLNTNQGEIKYYARILVAEDYALYEKLQYVKDFHDKTFDKEAVKELISYMETNSKADNTTYQYTNIHSNLNQLSWGDLNVTQVTDNDIRVREMEKRFAIIQNSYQVSTKEDNKIYYYNVVENYRIRYTEKRVYLLDFERTMDQIFNPEANVYASNKVMLGIRENEVSMMESDGGTNLAFINQGQLFCYHAADKKMASLFSFYQDLDVRTLNNQYGIKILNVNETGNVSFMVYGYMSRGQYEGRVGIQLWEYNGMLNTVEELIFIPYDRPFSVLKKDVEQLSFLNKSQIFYLYLDGNILAVDLNNQTTQVIADNLAQGSFQISQDEEMLVWQNEENVQDCTRLNLMNLNTGNTKEISATGNNRLKPLGFMGEDFIYGVAHAGDVVQNAAGAMTFPMYAVRIQNEEGDLLKNYEMKDIYVVGCEIQDNMITLKRVEKTEGSNEYTPVTDDQIVNNSKEESGYNSFETVVTQNYEKIVQLVLKSNIDTKGLKTTVPKIVLYEGSKELVIERNESMERYYVYGKDGVMEVYSDEAKAINHANSIGGTVVNQDGRYVWKKITRLTKNQIMAIKERKSTQETSDLAVCLETILNFEGSVKNVQQQLDAGKTVQDILKESLYDVTVLDLDGVDMDAVLYYVNQDIPVLANLKDGSARLIIGFNTLNIVVLDPQKGTIYKMGMNDSTAFFKENGNSFVTYLKAQS